MITGRSLALLIAVTSGLIVLLDRFVSHPLVSAAAAMLVDWAVLLAAAALLLGLVHLAREHLRTAAGLGTQKFNPLRTDQRRAPAQRRFLSLALVIALATTLAAGLSHPQGTNGPLAAWLFQYLQYPLQAALFSLLAFYLVSAAYRVVRPGGPMGQGGLLFLIAASLTLLSQLPGTQARWLLDARAWLLEIPTLAAVRGVLLGISLGAALTGLRVILGLSRPYDPPATRLPSGDAVGMRAGSLESSPHQDEVSR